jgi:hypothetical protein
MLDFKQVMTSSQGLEAVNIASFWEFHGIPIGLLICIGSMLFPRITMYSGV